MATSGSTNFSLNRNEIITTSLELLGKLAAGDTADSNDVTLMNKLLNMMVKAWQAKGIHIWTLEDLEITLVEEQRTYSLSPRPLHIISAVLTNSNDLDSQMTQIGRVEYETIVDKFATGKPNQYYYLPGRSTGTLYVWPTPDDDTDTINIVYARSIEDFDSSTDDPDFPTEWLDAIVLNLAVKAAPAFGINILKQFPDLKIQAQEALNDMIAWDSEDSNIKVVPARRDD